MITSNGGRPLHHHQKNQHAIDHQVTNQKALPLAIQLPLQQKNHLAPDCHTVALGLHTVVFSDHQLCTEYNLTRLSMLQALIPRVCHLDYKKNIYGLAIYLV
jgi:hypothetical protein